MTNQATPRPWKTGQGNAQGVYSHQTQICECFGETSHLTREEQLANARLIVKTVNCHDELVEALKLVLDPYTMIEEKIIIVKKALSKAGDL